MCGSARNTNRAFILITEHFKSAPQLFTTFKNKETRANEQGPSRLVYLFRGRARLKKALTRAGQHHIWKYNQKYNYGRIKMPSTSIGEDEDDIHVPSKYQEHFRWGEDRTNKPMRSGKTMNPVDSTPPRRNCKDWKARPNPVSIDPVTNLAGSTPHLIPPILKLHNSPHKWIGVEDC